MGWWVTSAQAAPLRRLAIGLVLLAQFGCTGTAGLTLQTDSGPADSGQPDSGPGPSDAGNGDTYLAWEGGPAYYAHWSYGPPSDANYFPIAVWLQSASNAAAFKAI